MTRAGLSLLTAVVLGGCQSREVVKLALDFDPPPAGLFVIPPVTAGGAPLVAIDPATGEGLELLVRQDPDEDAPWTAVLLKQPLSELGIEPGALSVGSGNRFWRRDYRVAQAVVGAASHPFQAVDGDPVIEALGLPFWEVRSPSFSLPCKRPQVLPITLAAPRSSQPSTMAPPSTSSASRCLSAGHAASSLGVDPSPRRWSRCSTWSPAQIWGLTSPPGDPTRCETPS